MNNSFLNRAFSRREKLLMVAFVVILLVGLYILLVHYPIVNRTQEIAQESEELLFQQDVANSYLATYNNMKAELDEIFKIPEDELTELPVYDNIQTLMLHLNRIFDGTDPSLSFDAVRIAGNIASRTVRFSFSATDYAHAREVIDDLTGTGFRCLLDSLSFSPSNGSVETGTLRVFGTITFYELVK